MLAGRYRNKVCLGRYLFCYFEVGILCPNCGKIVAKAIWQSNCLRSPKEKWFRLRSPFLLHALCILHSTDNARGEQGRGNSSKEETWIRGQESIWVRVLCSSRNPIPFSERNQELVLLEWRHWQLGWMADTETLVEID